MQKRQREGETRFAERRFCSKPCQHRGLSGAGHPNWQRERIERDARVCEHCGTTFTRGDFAYRIDADDWARRRFCSNACRTAHTIGDEHHDWKGREATEAAGRLRARRRYPDEPCEECASVLDIERHHVDRDVFNNEPSNIRILCRAHHRALHRGERGNPGGP